MIELSLQVSSNYPFGLAMVVLAMGEVLSFGFNLAVSLLSDRKSCKAHIVLSPSRITRWGIYHIA